ncbi:MAG: hypothetical protein IJF83_06120 [Methanobrevibacter sp.]|nr:hypothetical protein [Methanobrevibacter sp.]
MNYLYYDILTSDKKDNYSKNLNHTGIYYLGDEYLITQLDDSTSSYLDRRNLLSVTHGKTITFLVDIEFNNGDVQAIIMIGDQYYHSGSITTNGEVSVSANIPFDASSVTCRLYWYNNSKNDTLKLKKFLVYERLT